MHCWDCGIHRRTQNLQVMDHKKPNPPNTVIFQCVIFPRRPALIARSPEPPALGELGLVDAWPWKFRGNQSLSQTQRLALASTNELSLTLSDNRVVCVFLFPTRLHARGCTMFVLRPDSRPPDIAPPHKSHWIFASLIVITYHDTMHYKLRIRVVVYYYYYYYY